MTPSRARLLGAVRPPYCPVCHARPGPDCADRSLTNGPCGALSGGKHDAGWENWGVTIQLRDLTDADGGSCDWGGCDGEAVAARRCDEYGWLPVCARHAGRIPRRPSPGRGECEACGGDYAMTVDGRMPLHSRGYARCSGSRRDPVSYLVAGQPEMIVA